MTFPQTITAAEANKETPIGEMFVSLTWAALLSHNPDTTSGLTFGVNGGQMLVDGVLTTVADQTTLLAASSTNYVEATRTGTISDNASGFTAGRIPLYVVTTSGSGVTSFVDSRAWHDLPGVAGRLSLSVAGGTDVTLTAAQARNEILNFTGLLTANINVIVPNGPQVWSVSNNTTGAFTLTVKTAAGSGVAVTQTKALELAADGTNVIATNTDSAGGGTGSVTSVAATVPAFLSVSGSPITTAGTLALSYSGTALPVANGGTGATTLAAHGVVVGNGTGAIAVTGAGTAGQVLTSNGASADPTFETPAGGSAALTATYVGYGSGGNVLTGESTFTYDATYNTLSAKGAARTALTGTASSSGATVTGSGTLFLTELTVGDKIYANAGIINRTVIAIASNTSLTTETAFSPALSAEAITRSPALLRLLQSSGALGLTVNSDGQVTTWGVGINSGWAFSERTTGTQSGTLYSPNVQDLRIFDDNANRDVLTIASGDITAVGSFTSTKSTNATFAADIRNTSSGTAATTAFIARSDAGTLTQMGRTSSGYTTSGLFTATTGYIYNDSGTLLIAQAAAAPMVFSVGGFAAADEWMRVLGADGSGSKKGNIGIGYGGVANPQARLELRAGTATAGTAPLLIQAGTNLTVAKSGAIENDGTNLYYTDSTPTRRALLTNPMTTGGDVIYGGASGVPTRLANGSVGQVLTSAGTTAAPTWSSPGGGGFASAARVHATSTQSIAHNTNTAITFDSETSPSFDTDAYHDTGSNTSRFTIPTTGKYDGVANIFFVAASTGIRQIFWRVNGSTIYALAQQTADATNGNYLQSSLPALTLDAGDYLEIIAYQSSGVSITVGHASTTYQQSVGYIRRVI